MTDYRSWTAAQIKKTILEIDTSRMTWMSETAATTKNVNVEAYGEVYQASQEYPGVFEGEAAAQAFALATTAAKDSLNHSRYAEYLATDMGTFVERVQQIKVQVKDMDAPNDPRVEHYAIPAVVMGPVGAGLGGLLYLKDQHNYDVRRNALAEKAREIDTAADQVGRTPDQDPIPKESEPPPKLPTPSGNGDGEGGRRGEGTGSGQSRVGGPGSVSMPSPPTLPSLPPDSTLPNGPDRPGDSWPNGVPGANDPGRPGGPNPGGPGYPGGGGPGYPGGGGSGYPGGGGPSYPGGGGSGYPGGGDFPGGSGYPGGGDYPGIHDDEADGSSLSPLAGLGAAGAVGALAAGGAAAAKLGGLKGPGAGLGGSLAELGGKGSGNLGAGAGAGAGAARAGAGAGGVPMMGAPGAGGAGKPASKSAQRRILGRGDKKKRDDEERLGRADYLVEDDDSWGATTQDEGDVK